ncbi:hypothetical protein PRI8871_02952 [Pseudoprimorskyibacter insulae]|uniref:Uncharacterized protein n=1 Tax=Pseudoprimorskyibacter insulae TaxID=1695997 RepID=A0A2R8AYM1_9RHOB|nr:hypothetical protein PRI8871_02952 [Pseudoprimorskyibacter insulae]
MFASGEKCKTLFVNDFHVGPCLVVSGSILYLGVDRKVDSDSTAMQDAPCPHVTDYLPHS